MKMEKSGWGVAGRGDIQLTVVYIQMFFSLVPLTDASEGSPVEREEHQELYPGEPQTASKP